MNNNIKEAYCSFEVSKLLKEKGLDCGDHKTAYSEDGTRSISPYSSFYDPYKYPILDCTHSVAIEWIRVNFSIYISIIQNEYEDKFQYTVTKKENNSWYIIDNGKLFNTPQEATEAAIKYTLQNLLS